MTITTSFPTIGIVGTGAMGRGIAQIAAQVGHNVVTRLHIHGPVAPNWSRGPRRVRGRGPRDTYG